MWLQELVDSDSFTLYKTATSDRWGNALNYKLNLKTIKSLLFTEFQVKYNCMFVLLKCENIRSLFLKHIMFLFLMVNIYIG